MAALQVAIDSGVGAAPLDVLCLACDSARCDFSVRRMQRRAPRADDVVIDMKYCGVCHSDLHQAAGHMAGRGEDHRDHDKRPTTQIRYSI